MRGPSFVKKLNPRPASFRWSEVMPHRTHCSSVSSTDLSLLGPRWKKTTQCISKRKLFWKSWSLFFFLFGKVTIFYSELQNVTNLSMRVLTILQVMITWMVLEMRIFRTLCVIPDISKRSIKSRTASCQSASQSVKVAISCGATVLHRLAPYTGTNSEHLKNIR